MIARGLHVGVGGTAYQISAAPGIFSLTGKAVGLGLASASSPSAAPRFGFADFASSGYTLAHVQRVARSDTDYVGFYANVGGAVSGMPSPYPNTMGGYVDYGHSLNPNCKFIQYGLPDDEGTGGTTWADYTNLVNANPTWILRYANGSAVACFFNSAWGVANSTASVTADPGTGLKVEAACARLHWERVWNNTPASVDFAPGMDGQFHDNLIPIAPYTCDYERTGVNIGAGSAADQELRTGFGTFCTEFNSLAPGKLCVGNIGGWFAGGGIYGGGTYGGSNVTGMTNYNGGLIESLFGLPYSYDSYQPDGHAVKNQYQSVMAAVTAPKKVSVGCIWDSNGQGWYGTNHGLPNWQDARFQVCFTWQDDGEVCTANNTNYQADTAVWLDEFTVNPTTYVATGESGSYSGQHYFGTRTTPAWTMLSNGVYATQYYNAVTGRTTIVFCNLTGSSPQTINMAANFPGFTKLQKITGSQTSGQGINNGAQVASFVIQGHDGLIGYGVP